MNFIKNQILKTIFFLFFSISFSQTNNTDSLRGDFTYLLQYRPNTLNRDYVISELFSLQIADKSAFFSSVNRLKFDSAFSSQFSKHNGTLDFRNLPQSRSNYLIIQTDNNTQFYDTAGRTLLTYNSPIIDNWKLINESKVINSVFCKKAEVRYKGRDWIAWYSPEIPFPYGPFKFRGLPGLIIKLTDKTGDYDFEMVKSVSSKDLKGKIITLNKARYQNAKLVTKKELSQAWKNSRNNIKYELESTGTILSNDTRDKQRVDETKKNGYNPIELEE